MVHNIGSVERAFRILVGFLQVLLVVVGPRTLWGLAGLLPLLTGLLGYCPLFHVLGISTSDALEVRAQPSFVRRQAPARRPPPPSPPR